MKFRLGELFSGPGGIALGAHLASESVPGVQLEHAWATDYDRDTCATYVSNIPGATMETVHNEDVRTLDIARLPEIDAFAFGFPCNDFSAVGERKGVDGEFGPLYQYGVEVLNHHSPQWFLAENVGGLTNSNDGRSFRTILRELSEAGGQGGYELHPHLYKFEEYGVPQRRHRILIVGIRKDLGVEFRVPSPEPYADMDVDVVKRLTDPPIRPDAANNELTRQSEQVVKRLALIKPGQNAFNADLPPELQLNVTGARISQIYRRLEPGKPSYTVTGSGGGGTHVYHWSEPRALTNRERARIQTFPDSYVFMGSKESVRKQIGMAVPVDGARVIFKAILDSFAQRDYPWVEANLRKYLPQIPDHQPEDGFSAHSRVGA